MSDSATEPRKKFKRNNAKLRARAKQLLGYWFEDRCDQQVNRYRAVNGKPVMLERLVVSTARARPKLRRLTAEQEALAGRPHKKTVTKYLWDDEGKAVGAYTVPIEDALTADGRDSQHHALDGLQSGDAGGYVGAPRSNEARELLIQKVKTIMLQIHAIEPGYYDALEMRAAGYDDEFIAKEIGCGENMARKLVDEGVAVMCVYIMNRGLIANREVSGSA